MPVVRRLQRSKCHSSSHLRCPVGPQHLTLPKTIEKQYADAQQFVRDYFKERHWPLTAGTLSGAEFFLVMNLAARRRTLKWNKNPHPFYKDTVGFMEEARRAGVTRF